MACLNCLLYHFDRHVRVIRCHVSVDHQLSLYIRVMTDVAETCNCEIPDNDILGIPIELFLRTTKELQCNGVHIELLLVSFVYSGRCATHFC